MPPDQAARRTGGLRTQRIGRSYLSRGVQPLSQSDAPASATGEDSGDEDEEAAAPPLVGSAGRALLQRSAQRSLPIAPTEPSPPVAASSSVAAPSSSTVDADTSSDEEDSRPDGVSLSTAAGLARQERLRLVLAMRRHQLLLDLLELSHAQELAASRHAAAAEEDELEMVLERSRRETHGAGGGGSSGGSAPPLDAALLEESVRSLPFAEARGFLLCSDEDAASGAAPAHECAVCLSDLNEDDIVRVLPCVHVYHAKCIDAWFARVHACPTCKQAVQIGSASG